MKMLMLTDGFTCKITSLSSQKVNPNLIAPGVYKFEQAVQWITHGSTKRSLLNMSNYREDHMVVGIVFEGTDEREIIKLATGDKMRKKLAHQRMKVGQCY